MSQDTSTQNAQPTELQKNFINQVGEAVAKSMQTATSDIMAQTEKYVELQKNIMEKDAKITSLESIANEQKKSIETITESLDKMTNSITTIEERHKSSKAGRFMPGDAPEDYEGLVNKAIDIAAKEILLNRYEENASGNILTKTRLSSNDDYVQTCLKVAEIVSKNYNPLNDESDIISQILKMDKSSINSTTFTHGGYFLNLPFQAEAQRVMRNTSILRKISKVYQIESPKVDMLTYDNRISAKELGRNQDNYDYTDIPSVSTRSLQVKCIYSNIKIQSDIMFSGVNQVSFANFLREKNIAQAQAIAIRQDKLFKNNSVSDSIYPEEAGGYIEPLIPSDTAKTYEMVKTDDYQHGKVAYIKSGVADNISDESLELFTTMLSAMRKGNKAYIIGTSRGYHAIRQLKDGNHTFIYRSYGNSNVSSITSDLLKEVNGIEYLIDETMDSIAANTYPYVGIIEGTYSIYDLNKSLFLDRKATGTSRVDYSILRSDVTGGILKAQSHLLYKCAA